MSRLRQIQQAARKVAQDEPTEPVETQVPRLKQIQAKAKKIVEREGPVATEANDAALGTLADYQAALKIAQTKISAEKDMADKLRVKQALLPEFLPFVDDYVKQGHNYPNDVAATIMVWLLDTGHIEKGLELALYLLKHNQPMPKKFDRDLPTFLCDFFYDWAGVMLKEEQSASPYLDIVVAAMDRDDWDVHPLCKSKLYAMLAKHKERTEDFVEALALCEKAESVNPEKAGVKGLKERLQKKLS